MAGGRFRGQLFARRNLVVRLHAVQLTRTLGRFVHAFLLLLAFLVQKTGADVRASQTNGAALKSAPALGTAASPILPKLPTVQKPVPSQPAVGTDGDRHLDKTPPRTTKGLDLIKMGWSYNCMECHKLLEAKWHRDRPMVEHENIKLEHGNNRFCLNCHHPTNRNAFVDYDGAEIAEANAVLLCAKCHGPTFRDWEAGVHGRRNGFWNARKGSRTQLRCIQCHDPHEPAFQSLKPLPPPHYPRRAPGSPGHDEQLAQRKQQPNKRLGP